MNSLFSFYIATNCPWLDTPLNGKVDMTGQTLGHRAFYSCNEGYKLIGPSERFCQSHIDGQTGNLKYKWTGTKPSCKGMYCLHLLFNQLCVFSPY